MNVKNFSLRKKKKNTYVCFVKFIINLIKYMIYRVILLLTIVFHLFPIEVNAIDNSCFKYYLYFDFTKCHHVKLLC